MATCSSADSVLNAAAQIKSNAEKLNKFVNGTDSETVQLGTGAATPTLRNLAAHAVDEVAEAMGESITEITATISALQSGKADKVSSATNGHLAGLNASGNLTDSGLAKADVQTKLSSFAENNIRTTNANGFAKDSGIAVANVQQKLTGHTANHLLSVNSSGFMADSGIAKADVQTKLNGHTAGNVLTANSDGFMSDSGIASSNVALKSTDIAALQTSKANKVSGAVAGDIAMLDASGDLADSGRKTEDFVLQANHVELFSALINMSTTATRLSDRLTKVEIREAKLRAADRLAEIGEAVSINQISEIMNREVVANA